jgi:hypothetical protein
MRIRARTRWTNRPARGARVATTGGRLKLRWGGIGVVLLAIAGAGAFLLVATPVGRYLARAAWEEARILRGRQPITRLVRDTTLAPATRAKLQLVLEARAFAQDSLGLPARDAFTQFTDIGRDTLLLVLSGARKDRLEAKTWWFPVVGRVPYKGFFDVGDARDAERDLARDGYDTYLRPAAAFSTLGWFNDPLLSTTLRADSVDLVNTVIHELTHNRYFAKGEAVFNESFANFVGARGAERFFRSRGDTVRAALSRSRTVSPRSRSPGGTTTASSAPIGRRSTRRSTPPSARIRGIRSRHVGSRCGTRSTRRRGGPSWTRSRLGSARLMRHTRRGCGSTTRRSSRGACTFPGSRDSNGRSWRRRGTCPARSSA